jgi:hypothetical protein
VPVCRQQERYVKPRLLDLFCGAGGAAMGYSRAGFEVVGVDIEPQPNYPFEFHQAGRARLPMGLRSRCSTRSTPRRPARATAGSTAWRGDRANHPRLIAPVRELLKQTGLPYVIENVPDARRHLRHPLKLCGTALGLRVRRHRYFELSWTWEPLMTPCSHSPDDYSFDHGGKQPESVYRDAMGCGWMTVAESREAIPPAYTELIGLQLRQYLEHAEGRSDNDLQGAGL